MDFKRISDQWANWRPDRPPSVPKTGETRNASPEDMPMDDAEDGDHKAEVLRHAMLDQIEIQKVRIEEARRKALDLAGANDAGTLALQDRLANAERQRLLVEKAQREYVSDEMSIRASSTSNRDRFNAGLANQAETGPMELRDGKWIPYVAEPHAEGLPSDEVSEETPRPVRPSRENDIGISAK